MENSTLFFFFVYAPKANGFPNQLILKYYLMIWFERIILVLKWQFCAIFACVTNYIHIDTMEQITTTHKKKAKENKAQTVRRLAYNRFAMEICEISEMKKNVQTLVVRCSQVLWPFDQWNGFKQMHGIFVDSVILYLYATMRWHFNFLDVTVKHTLLSLWTW